MPKPTACGPAQCGRRISFDRCRCIKPDPLALQAERQILLIRWQRVKLDYDLATLYAVETRVLKQAVRGNLNRFPEDFMF